jgi:P2 family phage contractile tail tube protein
MNSIPQFLQNFNIYAAGDKLVGVSGDVTLPKFDNIGDTISGAGILGEFETPVPGAFKSQQLEVGFRIIDQTIFEMAAQDQSLLTFRGSQQINDYTKGGIVNQAIRVESKGACKGIELGKAAPGKTTDSKYTQEVLFIAVYIGGQEELYLDKLNYIYRLHGKDMLAGIRSNI